MREVTIKVYSFNELGEKLGKELLKIIGSSQ